MTPLDETLAAMEKALQAAMLNVRAEVREECARVVEGLKMPRSEYNVAYDHAAAAIRALEDKL